MSRVALFFILFWGGLKVKSQAGTASKQLVRAQSSLEILSNSKKVGLYEKVEFLIKVDNNYKNPYNPDEVDLSIIIKGPEGKKLLLPAFFCQEYKKRRIKAGHRFRTWMYPTGAPRWKARFAPMKTGSYTVFARLKDQNGLQQSEPIFFNCRESGEKGFIRVSRKDPRFLEYTVGEPFFPIGQNLAFIGDEQYVNLSNAKDIFEKLSENGANYLRIWTCCKDWAMAVEARKSCWGRSWAWKPPFVLMPKEKTGGKSWKKCVIMGSAEKVSLVVAPSHKVAMCPNTQYILSGRIKISGQAEVKVELQSHDFKKPVFKGSPDAWRRFSLMFKTGQKEYWLGRLQFKKTGTGTAFLDALSLREIKGSPGIDALSQREETGSPELLWEAEVNRSARGYYNHVDCFMLDESVSLAETHGIYLQLCILTRDLYMNALRDDKSSAYRKAIKDAEKLLRYAVARWGYSTSVAGWEYFNKDDPSLPTNLFYTQVGNFLERVYIYHHGRVLSLQKISHPARRTR